MAQFVARPGLDVGDGPEFAVFPGFLGSDRAGGYAAGWSEKPVVAAASLAKKTASGDVFPKVDVAGRLCVQLAESRLTLSGATRDQTA